MIPVNNIVFRLFVFTAGLLFLLPALGQYPDIQKIRVNVLAEEPVFTRALQDKNGYLWLGSDKGLFRYDGISFRQFYTPVDSAELHVTAIHEGQDGVLWIGCKDGRIYHLEKGVISIFNPEEGTAGKAITDIITDKTGVLWWSTAGEGIYYYYRSRIFNINHDDGLGDDYVYDLECDHNGLIWAGTDGGITACRQDEGRKITEQLDPAINLPDIMVRVIKEDQPGRLWLGFQDGGTGYIRPDRAGFNRPYPGYSWTFGPVTELAVLRYVTWVATASGALLEINPDRGTSEIKNLVKKEAGKLGRINDLLEDNEGNIWILSGSGLFRSSGTRLMFLKTGVDLTLENIHSVWSDLREQNKLWFSNDQGLFLLNLSDGNTRKYLEGINIQGLKITCLFQDNLGYIWAGTFNHGVFRIQPDDGTWIRITEAQGLINDNVLSISGHDDTLWMATLGGASEITLKGNAASGPFSITSHHSGNGLVSNFIYSVFEDSHDQIWFGTDGDGISVLTKKGWLTYNEENGLADDVIYSVTGDKYGNIWVASASNGIYKYSDGKFVRYGISDGLNNLDITGIIAVDDEVVVVHDEGLDILHIPTGRVAYYGEEKGLSGISPDLNVISRDRSGNLWIGTRNGIIRYQPGTFAGSYGPLTVLEEMSVYLEPRRMENDMVLGYGENHVSFRYAGLWFSNPEKVFYQVMLEGFDLGWKDTYDHLVIYSSLPPGKYTFLVRSSLDQSFRDASMESFQFRVREPFWMNGWFIIVIIAIVAGIIYSIMRYREKRLQRIEQQKKEKVEFEFQVLKNQVNPHFLFNSFSTLMSLIEEEPGQALQYTEKLSDFFRTILQFKDQDVITLKEELELVESYFFLLKKRFGDNINLEISLEKTLEKTFIPPMTLQILVENAVKHNIISKDRPLSVRIYGDERGIFAENNLQPKKIIEISTGIGLENIRKRYRLITKEEPVMEKTETVFRIKLPVIK